MPGPYRTPGVYVEEIATLPPSIAEVATAVPAFVGYTEIGPADGADPVVARIATMLDYRTLFGGPQLVSFDVVQPAEGWHPAGDPLVALKAPDNNFSLYYALTHYFKNGGGPCYVVSVGSYASTETMNKPFARGIGALEREDEPTLIVLTDAACLMKPEQYYQLCADALDQCKRLGDRFTIVDVLKGDTPDTFRNTMNSSYLMYGAAYHPYLQTLIPYEYDDAGVEVTVQRTVSTELTAQLKIPAKAEGIVVSFVGRKERKPAVAVVSGEEDAPVSFSVAGDVLTIHDSRDATGAEIAAAWLTWPKTAAYEGFEIAAVGQGGDKLERSQSARELAPTPEDQDSKSSLAALKAGKTALYSRVKAALDEQYVMLPPSAAMAGIYARVDRDQGVWKAPANVPVMAVLGPAAKITDREQETLNIDATAGKSINAIRDFTGRGTLVWGSRTLAGNDNEWRYVPVRRLFITIEESSKKASAFAVFEPNDQTTWLKVKAMVESYLYGLWERGALAGAKPEQAYYVHVGLGTTMTPQDVLEGRLIVEIGVAAVRPAEFIVLKFSHKLQTA